MAHRQAGTFSRFPATLSNLRGWHAAVALSGGEVLLAGGVDVDWASQAGADIIDVNGGEVITGANAVFVPRSTVTATILADRGVLVAGGGDPDYHISAAVEVFDPATRMFAETVPMNKRRGYHAAAPLSGAQVVVVGGYGRIRRS